MTVKYYPEVDMLTMALADTPFRQEDVRDTDDPDVLLLYDDQGRLAKIEVSHASKKINLEEMRRKISFEEVPSGERSGRPQHVGAAS